MLQLAFRVVICLILFDAIRGLRQGRISSTSFDASAPLNWSELRKLEKQGGRRRVIVEGSAKASKFSPSDMDALLLEQAYIIDAISGRFPTESVRLLHAERNIANAMFFSLPTTYDDDSVDKWIGALSGVVSISQSIDLEEDNSFVRNSKGVRRALEFVGGLKDVREIADTYLGAGQVREKHCLSGKGIRIAVVDSGIDYTHALFGGPGTEAAYQSASASDRPRADGLFPTKRVVDGRNFIYSSGDDDSNPLDQPAGHGTGVATAILSMAPDAELMAYKVCDDESGTCPDYAVIAAIDHAYEHGAHVVNLSLGQRYSDGYYHILARVIQEVATTLGMTIVVPSGNYGNRPFIMGGIANVENAITVGATSATPYGIMAAFSSRGPGTLNTLKPDISAPGGAMLVAKSGSGQEGVTAEGTSYSCPVVAGAAAVIKSKCPDCSPFIIKALLMNTAQRTIKYNSESTLDAPVSWIGSGEINITKAVEASFWAYSLNDGQPSISLGLLDVTSDMVIRRTILVTSLTDKCQGITAQGVLRNPAVTSGAMEIMTTSSNPEPTDSCYSTFTIEVEFQIEASQVPSNHMTSGGFHSGDPGTLDQNEFDGWISIVSSNGQEIHIPFHGILRKAAQVAVAVNSFPSDNLFPADFPIGLENTGAGTAQIDMYELLAISEDDAEPVVGNSTTSLSPPADFKYVGYRTLPDDTCGFILEFAFQLWERRQTLFNTEIQVAIDVNGDRQEDFILANRGPRTNTAGTSDCRIQAVSGDWECTGFVADHATNSATAVVRACANDMGISPMSTIGVSFSSATYPSISTQADSIDYTEISVPCTISSMPTSCDVLPGGQLSNVLSGASSISNSYAKGLLIFSNGYRNAESTGAATASSEAIAIPFPAHQLPAERTKDHISFIRTPYIAGPGPEWYTTTSKTCSSTRKLNPMVEDNHGAGGKTRKYEELSQDFRQLDDTCTEKVVPRVFVPTAEPSRAPEQLVSNFPSPDLGPQPSRAPSSVPTRPIFPTSRPTSNGMLNENLEVIPIPSGFEKEITTDTMAENEIDASSDGPFIARVGVFWQTAVVALVVIFA